MQYFPGYLYLLVLNFLLTKNPTTEFYLAYSNIIDSILSKNKKSEI